jgi:quinol monooxygenase YgiN
MFGLVVRFTLKDGAAADFDRLVETTVTEIHRHEHGTLVYAVHQVEGDPNTRIFYELYRNRAAFEDHERQDHTRQFMTERERYLDGPPRVDFLELQRAAGAVGSLP